MDVKTMAIARAVENMALTVGIVVAAISFGRAAILWFLLLPAMNHFDVKTRTRVGGTNDEETE